MISLKLSEDFQLNKRSLKNKVYIAIPKSVVPLAVRRNRIRRLLKEVLRKENFLETKKPCLLIVKKADNAVDFHEVEFEVKKLISSCHPERAKRVEGSC